MKTSHNAVKTNACCQLYTNTNSASYHGFSIGTESLLRLFGISETPRDRTEDSGFGENYSRLLNSTHSSWVWDSAWSMPQVNNQQNYEYIHIQCNGVRRPRQIRRPKIRANVPPKRPCWRHRVCHLGADCRRLGSTLASWRWQGINVGNPLWRRAL